MVVDMHAPGVEVRPLRQMTGSSEFNEVFLDDVRVPAANLVGEEGKGWEIAQTTLAHERGTAPRQLVIHRMLLEDLLRVAREDDDAGALRQSVAAAAIEVEIAKLNNWRTLTRLVRGEPLGPESSFIKLYWSEMSQRMHDTVMRALGPRAALWGSDAPARGRLADSYLYYRRRLDLRRDERGAAQHHRAARARAAAVRQGVAAGRAQQVPPGRWRIPLPERLWLA